MGLKVEGLRTSAEHLNPFERLKNWRWVTAFLIAFGLCIALRLLDLPQWNAPHLEAGGERLAARADSYAWFAGAKEINHYTGHPLSVILRFLHTLTGFGIGELGFWLPAIAAPLAALPICLLAAWWGVPASGIVSGVMAGASFGYLSRTRIGTFDTDVVALFFPVCLAVLLVVWLETSIRRPWGCEREISPGKDLSVGFLLGLLFKVYLLFYAKGGPIGLVLLVSAAIPGIVLTKKGRRCIIAAAFLVIFLVGNGSWAACGISLGSLLLAFRFPFLFERRWSVLPILAILGSSLFLVSGTFEGFFEIGRQLIRYGDRSLGGGIISFPSTLATVLEARSASLVQAFLLVAGNWLLFSAGLTGFVYLLVRHPCAVVFAPLLLLAMASVKLGTRFTMYGGVTIGLGLGCGLALMAKDLRQKPLIQACIQVVVLAGIFWAARQALFLHKPFMFLPKVYAESLIALKEETEHDSQLWVWWDYGYAAQYYAERMTFADGSRNRGEYLVPLGWVYTTDSVSRAYEIMEFVAREQQIAGPEPNPKTKVPLYPNPLVSQFPQMGPDEAQRFFEKPKVFPPHKKESFPEQCLVLSWDNLRIAETISSFGSWNFLTRKSSPGKIFLEAGRTPLDLEKGEVMLNGKVYKMRSIDLLGDNDRKHLCWPERKEGLFVLRNTVHAVTVAMDEVIYNSLMIQMLISEPGRFEPYFRLLIDRSPFVRVYGLNPMPGLTPDVKRLPAPVIER